MTRKKEKTDEDESEDATGNELTVAVVRVELIPRAQRVKKNNEGNK